MLKQRSAHQSDWEALATLWEASVKQSHAFLTAKDIETIKTQLPNYFAHVDPLTIWFEADKPTNWVGFSGVVDQKLEMLFLAPTFWRKGYGKQILAELIQKGVTAVDVNEDNAQATAFYLSQGFEVSSRSLTDDAGNPFPILHLKLASEA